MTTRLEHALRLAATDAAEEAQCRSAAPGADALAAAAWGAGRRRRRRDALLSGAAALVVAVLVIGWFVGMPGAPRTSPPASPSTSQGVRSHPGGIAAYALVGPRLLPEKPGPLAGLFNGHGGWPWQDDSERWDWYGFDARGHVWRLPHNSGPFSAMPALSDDGRWLGFRDQDCTCYAIRNLATGVTTRFAETRDRPALKGADGWLSQMGGVQTPWRFSPSGRLVLNNYIVGETWLLAPDGSARRLADTPNRTISPGWLDDHRFLSLDAAWKDSATAWRSFTVTIEDVDAGSSTTQQVELGDVAADFDGAGQWTPRFTADRRTLFLLSAGQAMERGVLRYDVGADSRLRFAPRRADLPLDPLPGGWSSTLGALQPVGPHPALVVDNQLMWGTTTPLGDGATRTDETTVMRIHPRWQVDMTLFAADAFAGPATGRVPNRWLAWWWPQLLQTTALVGLAAAGGRGIRLLKWRRIPGATTHPATPHRVETLP